jgi:prepilin-type N-terminal cleavage/methylation domain-containing protein
VFVAPKNMRISDSCRGFSLVELLVSITLLALLAGLGLVKYNTYNQQQVVVQAASDLKNNLRLIQNKALSGEKDCSGTLEGYEVTFGTTSYTYCSRCSGGASGTSQTYNLPDPVQFTLVPTSLFFKVLAQGVLINGSSQIDVTAYGRTESVAVSSLGEIR